VIGLFSIVSKGYSSKQVNNVATSQLHNIGTQQPQSLAHEATIAPPATQSPAPITKPTDNSNHFGRVQETMNSSGYTYVLIDEGSQNTWVAVMETKVKVGDIIEFPDSEPMLNFQSKSLNKTFDKIIFAPSLLIHSSKTAGAKTITRNNEYSEKNNTNNNNTKSNNAHAQKIDFKIGTLRTGYIIQIATGDGYTYLDVNTTDEYMGSTWIACNNASLKVGNYIKFRHSKIYNNVNSKDIPNVVFNKIMYTSCEKDKE
jgi:hypothetical protein